MDQLPMNEQKSVAALQQKVAMLSDQLQQSEKALHKQRKLTKVMKARALDATRLKIAFFANISHEVRTPMNAIMGFTQLMQETELTEQQFAYLQQITAGGEALMRLIDALFDLSSFESGNVELKNDTVVLRELVERLSSRLLPDAESKGLAFDIHLHDSVPDQMVGDRHRIEQILCNLVENAIKFTEQGRVALDIDYTPLEPSDAEESGMDGVLKVSVKDSGIGIDHALNARLFQPFSLGDDSLTRRQGGSGMGLAICHHILRLMGGEITVSSVEGEGSDFRVSIPLRLAVPSTDSLIGRKVLLVDDSMSNRQIANEILSDWGIVVMEAEDGAQAIRMLKSERCDLVLMDLLMPVMGGLAATREIRNDARFSSLPIVAMTGNSGKDNRLECLAAGMNDVLSKPINFDVLPQQLLAWLHDTGKSAADLVAPGHDVKPATMPSMLPAIADADRDQALWALGGQQALYAQLLEYFPTEHASTPTQIRMAMDQCDFITCERLAHTLKSSASSLGARLLMESAAELEQLFHAGEKATEAMLQILAQRCTQLVQLGLDQRDLKAGGRVADCQLLLPHADFMAKIEELSSALIRGEERAIAMLEEMLPQLQDLDRAGADEISTLVDGFDFVAAAARLQQMLNIVPFEEG
ncbi:MAG: response regulator [Mariprofundales bacterium]